MLINSILNCDVIDGLKQLEDESVDTIMTSPPYYNLRDYQVEGQIGNEKTIQEYIDHLMQVFNECKRVLKKTGSCWVVIGDTYGTKSGGMEDLVRYGKGVKMYGQLKYKYEGVQQTGKPKQFHKSLLMIPERFAMAMIDSKWILRNKIIWQKRNVIPSSAKDRFTVDYENIYFFVKSSETLLWYNKKTGEIVNKKPKGRFNGVEGRDWDWIEHAKESDIPYKITEWGNDFISGQIRVGHMKLEDGVVYEKEYHWHGRDYYFTTQYEPYSEATLEEFGKAYNGKGIKDYEAAGVQNPSDVKRRIIARFNTDNTKYEKETPTTNVGNLRNGSWQPVDDIITTMSKYVNSDVKVALPYTSKIVARAQSRDIAKILFPGDSRKQRQFIREVHEKGGHIMKGIMPPIGGVKKANGDNPTYSGNRAPWKFGRIKRTVWTINTKPFKGAHFAVFPEELVREVINAGCPENGIILDPFMGAGTVALVALKMNRNFLGIELKKEYVDMAYKRIDPWLNQEKILQSL